MNNCYCGHPSERHMTKYLTPYREEYGEGPCLHCPCKEYAESQEPKALEDCRFCPTKNGVHIHPCIKDVECQRCGLPYDVHIQILDHGFKAKPQEALEEKECGHVQKHCENHPTRKTCCFCFPKALVNNCAFKAKPQEEPKKCCGTLPDGNGWGHTGPCATEKETESIGCYCPSMPHLAVCPLYGFQKKENEPKEETDAEWEERQARELAECFNVMPKNMAEHQRNVYNAVRDAIYLCRKRFIKSQE